jgi:hypothetical protein
MEDYKAEVGKDEGAKVASFSNKGCPLPLSGKVLPKVLSAMYDPP